MPGWGKGRPEDDRHSWKLVHFVRHLPEITEQEMEEMKPFNPISQKEKEGEENHLHHGEDVPSETNGHHHD